MRSEADVVRFRDELIAQMNRGASGYEVVGAIRVLNWVLTDTSQNGNSAKEEE